MVSKLELQRGTYIRGRNLFCNASKSEVFLYEWEVKWIDGKIDVQINAWLDEGRMVNDRWIKKWMG